MVCVTQKRGVSLPVLWCQVAALSFPPPCPPPQLPATVVMVGFSTLPVAHLVWRPPKVAPGGALVRLLGVS